MSSASASVLILQKMDIISLTALQRITMNISLSEILKSIKGIHAPPVRRDQISLIFSWIQLFQGLSYCEGTLQEEATKLDYFVVDVSSFLILVNDVWMQKRVVKSNFSSLFSFLLLFCLTYFNFKLTFQQNFECCLLLIQHKTNFFQIFQFLFILTCTLQQKITCYTKLLQYSTFLKQYIFSVIFVKLMSAFGKHLVEN